MASKKGCDSMSPTVPPISTMATSELPAPFNILFLSRQLCEG